MNKNYEYFTTVAKELNFTKAADLLYISQSALSKYISRLEASLGIVLFDRSSTPLKLTYAGELYLQYLEDSRQLDQELLQKFSELNSHERGQIQLGITSFRGSYILPAVMPAFTNRYPLIRVVLTEGINPFLINEVLNERVHFCIADPIDTVNYSLFDYESIFHEKICLAISPKCPLAKRYVKDPDSVQALNRQRIYPPFDIGQIRNEPFFMTHTRQSMSHVIENSLSKNRIHLSNVFRCSNLTTAINLALSGLGFTFIPEFSLQYQSFAEEPLLFSSAEPPLRWEHAVFFKKGCYVSSHCRLFINTLKEVFAGADGLQPL